METALADYRMMATIRAFEDRLMKLKADGRVPGSIHLCNGQEAIPTAGCRALGPDDALTATYRGHGWAIARGVPLADLFGETMGRDSPLCGGRAGSPYLTAPTYGFMGENSIVGAGVPIAMGAAMASSLAGDGTVSLVSIGDGALSQGATHEALNFAAAFSYPLVVVVENNRYSEMTPVADMVNIEPLSQRASGYGIPGTTVDGNDPEATFDAIANAVVRARDGGGPSLVEALTERLVGHHSGDVQHYRPSGEVADARTREPLVRMRGRLGDEAVGDLDAIDREVAQAVDEAVAAAERMPEPDAATVREHLLA